MRILIATGLYPPESGGPATYAKLLEDRLPALGFEVSVLPFRTVRHLPPIIRHAAYFFKVLWSPGEIVLAQDTLSVGFPAMLAAKLTRRPFVVRVPGDYVWEQGRQRWGVKEVMHEFRPELYGWKVRFLHYMQSLTLRATTKTVSPSSYLAEHIKRWGVPAQKIVIINNGIESPVPVQLPHERPQGFLVVSVGRLVPWKGMDGLIRVIARETAWQCVIVDEGPEEGSLQRLARELGCKDRVHFVGRSLRPQALGWVKAADVFVLNSSYEGMSHLLIEAMSLGAPIVATDIGGNPELVRNEQEGLLILAHNDDALHAALKRLERDTELRARLARAAQERSREFSIDRTLASLVELLKTL